MDRALTSDVVSLSLSLELLNGGRKEPALDALVEVWGSTRAPEVADLIDVLSDDITRSLEPIAGKTRRAFQESWLDIANEGRSSDLGRLLVSFSREPCTQIPERLSRLEMRAPDPRIARALWSFVGRCPCTSTPNLPLWTRLFKLLQDIGDVRMRAALIAKLDGRRESGSFHAIFYPRIEKTLAGLVDPPPLSDEDAALVARLATRTRGLRDAPPTSARAPSSPKASARSEDELLATVFEDPEADGPRLVYGDWLLERGDPRGEFITLQFKRLRERLTRAEEKRERALLQKHGRRWLGAIEPVVVAKADEPLRFERGFVSRCTVRFRTPRQRALIGHPLWSTVREIHEAPFELCVDPTMRSLCVITGAPQSLAARLADEPRSPLPIEGLRFSADAVGSDEHARIARGRSLPALRRLTVDLPMIEGRLPPSVLPSELEWLLRGELAERLEELTVIGSASYAMFDAARPDLGPWLEAAAPLGRLTRLAFDLQFDWKCTVTRAVGSTTWRLELHAYDPSDIATLIPILRGVPPKTFARVLLPEGAQSELTALVGGYVV